MADFFGDYEQTIDAKRRLPVTSGLRELIPPKDGTNFVLLLGPNARLWLYPDQYFRRLYREMKSSDMPNEEFEAMAEYFAKARVLKPDAQGRVVLPERFLQEAQLGLGEVFLVGLDDHIEVWEAQAWMKHQAEKKADPTVVRNVLSTASRQLSRKALEARAREREQEAGQDQEQE